MFWLHVKIFFYKLYTRYLALKALYYVYYDKVYFQIYAFDLFWRFNYHLTMPYWTVQSYFFLYMNARYQFTFVPSVFSLHTYVSAKLGYKYIKSYIFFLLGLTWECETEDFFNINIPTISYNSYRGRDDYSEILLFWKWWFLAIYKPLIRLNLNFFQKVYRFFWLITDYISTLLPIFFIKYYLHEKYTRAIWPFIVKITWA